MTMLINWYSDKGVNQGDTGRVSGVRKNMSGEDYVSVKWDGAGRDVKVLCGSVEILN